MADAPLWTEEEILRATAGHLSAAARAPMNGVVAFRRVNVAARVDTLGRDTPLFRIVDNRLLDLTVPSKQLQEAGTYVIPGHGRISDEHEVVWYRDMLVIIRDRIRDMVGRKMTLDQVQAAKPALDYEGRYGAETGPWTTAMFVEAIYKDLSRASAAGGK